MKKFSFLALCLLLWQIVAAQSYEFNPNEAVPLDPNVKIGTLQNGLTYYIRQNEKPKDRAEFYLVVNAGAINEDDDQDGLAHLCEHMAFNGTKRFAKKQILDYLQRIGMKFGPEINAFTSHDVTCYMLQNVPIDQKANIDTALMILCDWAGAIAFEPEEIDKERGVVREEWRLGRDGMSRMQRKSDKVTYRGSKYAERDVIGSIDIINNAPYAAFTRFYNDFYRPDLQAIIAVGDFDVKQMENYIIQHFSNIPKKENPRKREFYPVPDHDETLISIEKDVEAPYTYVQILYKHPNTEVKNMGYYRQQFVNRLYNSMMQSRFQELMQKPDCPFSIAYTGYYGITRTKDAYFSYAMVSNNNALQTIKILLQENERVKNHGFTQTELDRAKISLLRQYEKNWKEKNKETHGNYIWEYYSHFLDNEPTPGIDFDLNFVKNILPTITLAELNNLPKQWITTKNRVIVVNGPAAANVSLPTENEIRKIITTVENEKIEAYIDKTNNEPLISNVPKAQKLLQSKYNPALECTEWKLKNGITVMVKPTNFKEDEILFKSFSFGGSNLYPINDYYSAIFASNVVNESGVGDFSKTELQKLLAGKIIHIYPNISDVTEGFEGSFSPQDIETAMQMLYLYFTKPRFDSSALNNTIKMYKVFLENKQLDPEQIFRDSVQTIMTLNHPYTKPLSVETLKKIDLKKIEKIYKERYADAGDMVFTFVGNIDTIAFKPLVETYLSNLPSIKRKETYKDLNIQRPKEVLAKTIHCKMVEPKSQVYIEFHGSYQYKPETKLIMDALEDILDVRYTETIREEESGTYGVWVYTQHNHYPNNTYRMIISFSCSVENADRLAKIALNEIEKIQQNGPEEKYLANFKTNKIKEWEEKIKENNYWVNSIHQQIYHQIPFSKQDEYVKRVNAISIQDVQNAAKTYLKMNQYGLFILKPE